MIVVCLLLIVAAVVLLGIGLLGGTNGYLVGSIAASLLASVALIVSGRQNAAKRVGEAASSPNPPTGGQPRAEPPVQVTSVGDAARVAALDAEVFVVHGRPRYHLRTCGHLRGGGGETLSAKAAIESGFTPCGRCEPDTMLLGAEFSAEYGAE